MRTPSPRNAATMRSVSRDDSALWVDGVGQRGEHQRACRRRLELRHRHAVPDAASTVGADQAGERTPSRQGALDALGLATCIRLPEPLGSLASWRRGRLRVEVVGDALGGR